MPSDALKYALSDHGPILLDFDGPVTLLLPGDAGLELAERTRHVLIDAGVDIPDDIAATSDHLAVLSFGAGIESAELRAAVEDASRQGEIEAATRSTPTDGAHDLLRAASRAGRPVVIVTNNAADAARTHLERYDVSDLVTTIIGRQPDRPDLMKPNTAPIDRAVDYLGVMPQDCVLIGDSVTDVVVSARAHVRSIGYAKTPKRGEELTAAGADAITDDIGNLAAMLADTIRE